MGIERGGRSPQNPNVQPSENPRNLEAALKEGGLQIWGDVKFRADAVLHGKIRGSVDGMEKIIVSQDASVSGAVRGSDVRVEGEVQGGVTASGRVWIGPKGKVRMLCSGKTVRIEPGAEFRGELNVG
jgi:cytoskeletal protein CcmA (bactofilin family)